MGFTKTWFASILSALVGAAAIFAPQAQAFIAAHPAWAGVIAAVGAIIAHILPSPRA